MTTAYKPINCQYPPYPLQSLAMLLFLLMSTAACNDNGSRTKGTLTANPPTVVSQLTRIIPEHPLLAWCIVPYDSVERGPAARMKMLNELGFTQYVYDWREQHLASFAEEIQQAREADIQISGVWMWIDQQSDSVGALSTANEELLGIMEEHELQTQIWLGINHNFFEAEDETGKIAKAVEMVSYLNQRANDIGCTLALYNHGDWFGEPDNQLRILQELDNKEIGMIYNFHHAHHQIEEFPALLKRMQPYLWAVNLNGMRQDGPKILPIGSGESEADMIHALLNSDYSGPIGILGHIEDEDVKVVLRRNLEGLSSLLKTLKIKQAGS